MPTALLVARLLVARLLVAHLHVAHLLAARLHAGGAHPLGVHHLVARRPRSVRGRHPLRAHIPATGAGPSSSATLLTVRDAREQVNKRRMNRPDVTSLTRITDAAPAKAVEAPAVLQQQAGFLLGQNEPVSSFCSLRSIPSLVSRVLLGHEMAS
eukprot:1201213-Pleurochrysis_carterae.AAC.1